MILNLLFTNPLIFFIYIASLLIAITIHEFSHAFVADKLGDPTAKINNRVTLNPLAHIDPIGAIALLIAGFGWGKSVPYDPYNLGNPKRDSMLIALAGPTSNLILSILLAILIRFFPTLYFLIPVITINVSLAIFNLLPIPPLDGSKILTGILSNEKALKWELFSRANQSLLLIFFILPLFKGNSLASLIISPIINYVLSLLALLANFRLF